MNIGQQIIDEIIKQGMVRTDDAAPSVLIWSANAAEQLEAVIETEMCRTAKVLPRGIAMDHELKTWPVFYADVVSGRKPFEVRKADRPFQEGDVLILREWSTGSGYSGRYCFRRITYILPGGDFGVAADHVVLGLGVMTGGRS